MSKVYLTQEIPVDRDTGQPKYNVLGAQKYGDIVMLLPMYSQIILFPGPLIIKLRTPLNSVDRVKAIHGQSSRRP